MFRGSRYRSGLALARAGWALVIILMLASSGFAATVQRQSIQVVLAASPATAAKMEAALRDSFARRSWLLDLRTVATIDAHAIAAPHPGQPKSSVWLDLVAPRKALYLVDETQGLVYTRPLDVHDDPDAVELELITFVVESSIDAMQAGDIQGVPKAEFERQLGPVEPLPARAPSQRDTPALRSSQAIATPAMRLAFAGGYHAELVRNDAIAHGLFATTRWQPARLALDGSLRIQWPMHVTAGDLDMQLWSSSVRVHAALPIPVDDRVLLLLGVGGGWQITHVVPGGAGAVAPFWASAPQLSSFVAVERSWRRVFLSVRFDLDFDLIQVRYRTRRGGVSSTDWRPHSLRPAAAALVGFRY